MLSLDATSDLLGLFAEPSRVRLCALLAEQELTVNEIVAVTELGQSRVSTHLGKLREAGLLRDRRAGGSTFYRMANGEMPPAARKLWTVVAAEMDDEQLAADRRRAAAVLRARETRDANGRWAETVAGEMERHYSPGRTWEAVGRGLIGLMRLGHVLDAGGGDGAMTQLLAPRAERITCADVSPTLIEAAQTRLAGVRNARAQVADVQDLPFDDDAFDDVLLLNVLTHVTEPARAVRELGRVLRPGGRLVVVTLAAHEHLDVTRAYGHLHAGFTPAEVARYIDKAGLVADLCEITSRERRSPYFQVVTAFAAKPVSAKQKKTRTPS